MEEWNVGILGIRALINGLNCQKILQIHHSNWGEAPKFFLDLIPDLFKKFRSYCET
jgi:hypothetical protein